MDLLLCIVILITMDRKGGCFSNFSTESRNRPYDWIREVTYKCNLKCMTLEVTYMVNWRQVHLQMEIHILTCLVNLMKSIWHSLCKLLVHICLSNKSNLYDQFALSWAHDNGKLEQKYIERETFLWMVNISNVKVQNSDFAIHTIFSKNQSC